MFNQDFLLSSLSVPWAKHHDPNFMAIYPETSQLSDLKDIESGLDIALQNSKGEFVGAVPYETIIRIIFQQWKISSSYYNTLLETIEDAVTAIDQGGNIISWNERAQEMFKWPESEILGKPITDYFPEDNIKVMSVVTEGKEVRRQYHHPRENVHVLINAAPVRMDDHVIGGISVEHDITDMVRLSNELSQTTAYVRDLETQMENGHHSDQPFARIKGRSPALLTAIQLAERVAVSDVPVMITGESGVGKELFAQSIHAASRHADGPFIDINCGAIPASLFESELFGYEKGAFTGASTTGKKGKLDAAKGGTLFLDEIGELPLDLQVKLLRVLQEKQFYRIGGTQPIPIKDVRIVSATNRDVDDMIESGDFREDLYYRLNVVSIHVPPLRERIEDLPHLIQLFMQEFSVKYSKPIPEIDPELMYVLLHHNWPGNIRQLRNVMERLMILCDGDAVSARHLPRDFAKNSSAPAPVPPESFETVPDMPVPDEKTRIEQALMKTYNNKSAAAEMLGISRATLYNKIRKYGL